MASKSLALLFGDGPKPGMTPPWGLRDVLLGVALPITVWAIALGMALASGVEANGGLSTGDVISGLLLTLGLQAILVGLAAGLTLARRGLSWRDLGFRPFARNRYVVPVAVALGGHVLVMVYVAIVAATNADSLAPEQGLEDLFQSRTVLPLVGVVTVLTAPLAEETFFRGFVFPGLIRRLGTTGAALASGFLFAAFHVFSRDSVGLVIPFTVIGVALAVLYYRTGSLWSSIIAHFTFNLVSFIFLAVLIAS